MNIENSSRFIKSKEYFLLSTYFHIVTFELNQNVQEAPDSYVINHLSSQFQDWEFKRY